MLSTEHCKPRSCPDPVQLYLPTAAAAAAATAVDVLAVAKVPPWYYLLDADQPAAAFVCQESPLLFMWGKMQSPNNKDS